MTERNETHAMVAIMAAGTRAKRSYIDFCDRRSVLAPCRYERAVYAWLRKTGRDELERMEARNRRLMASLARKGEPS